MIQTIFKSDSEKIKDSIEKFHFANSKKFFDILAEKNLLFIYKSNLHTIILTDEQKEILTRKEQSRALIDEYTENHYNYTLIKNKEENKEHEEFQSGKINLKMTF